MCMITMAARFLIDWAACLAWVGFPHPGLHHLSRARRRTFLAGSLAKTRLAHLTASSSMSSPMVFLGRGRRLSEPSLLMRPSRTIWSRLLPGGSLAPSITMVVLGLGIAWGARSQARSRIISAREAATSPLLSPWQHGPTRGGALPTQHRSGRLHAILGNYILDSLGSLG